MAVRYTSTQVNHGFDRFVSPAWQMVPVGGTLPLLATAMVAFAGNIYYGLWYPIVVAMACAVIGVIFLRDTKGTELDAVDVK